MKLSSPKTYRVVRFALEKGSFKQNEVHKSTGVSIGLVNRVTAWMVSRGFAAKSDGAYTITAPAGLAHTFNVFRRMEDLEIGSFAVDADEKTLQDVFKKHDGISCLTTALRDYDDYFREPVFHVYGTKELCNALKRLPSGTAHVVVYENDLPDPEDVISNYGVKHTEKIRTIIDLLCSHRAYAAERFIQKLWRST